MRSARFGSLLLACCLALPAQAILIRPDRDDAEYLELASRYPSSIRLPDGDGVLIAPRWILTSAEVAQALRAGSRSEIAGQPRAVQSIFVHPGWKPGAAENLALVLLREPVEDIEPAPIHRRGDERGKAVIVVGHGRTGKIGAAALAPADHRKRAAINTVDRVRAGLIGLRIKAADEASDLQGALGPGDAGAGAYFETKEGIFVAGIAHRTEDTNADRIFGNIGDWEHYVRIPAFAEWIDVTMFKAAVDETQPAKGDAPLDRGRTPR